ncbi:hypothetical protein PR08_gp08 [Idiomarinaceae phage Phi1M2-2]|nr:hypothetical protein PR08_gp08 [Idiomarinaceae phage Phi1M2-2]AIM40766.1 hypothetical protein M22_008 [Idiomarinaceae phage Phi1M2-2]
MLLETVKLKDGRVVNKKDAHKYETKQEAHSEPKPKAKAKSRAKKS